MKTLNILNKSETRNLNAGAWYMKCHYCQYKVNVEGLKAATGRSKMGWHFLIDHGGRGMASLVWN